MYYEMLDDEQKERLKKVKVTPKGACQVAFESTIGENDVLFDKFYSIYRTLLDKLGFEIILTKARTLGDDTYNELLARIIINSSVDKTERIDI